MFVIPFSRETNITVRVLYPPNLARYDHQQGIAN